ncbi:SpoIIE family protein phosphatase [Streptomyces sp. P17]|uniref:SpoIIE family protein phosphatase n=1 Tax=Streptomyces sp. P17 TaxID=3074716 RepID=UPI0028F40414|nr:SpoIIE family protein phosphatase [Streptomyces sp. P17]MDT9700873.1 SpoIIE family protein phosphatase [Streptomyces sp. P17]
MNTPHRGRTAARRSLDDALLSALFSQSPIGLQVWDPQLRLVRANTATRRIESVTFEELVGRPLPEVLGAFAVTDPDFLLHTARSVLETGIPVLDQHVHARKPRNPAVELLLSVALFRLDDTDGTVLGLTSAVTDISEQTRAQAGLRLLNRAAVSVGTTLGMFRTAEEMCDLAVPQLADAVAVDVLDPVLRGETSAPLAMDESALLRCVGFHALSDVGAEASDPRAVRNADIHPIGTPYQQVLSTLAPRLVRLPDPDNTWLVPTRRRDAALRSAGVHSMMVMPLRARGGLLGLARFYRWRNPAPFEADDLALAEQLAAYTALCVDNARLYHRELAAARMLHHHIRQSVTSNSPAVETARAYLPTGTDAGWFDVIPLSGARVALVAGDSPADRLDAIASMAELRAAMAALSQLDIPPDELMERLHDLAGSPASAPSGTLGTSPRPDRDSPATCLYAVYDPVSRICTMVSAGHPAPALVHPHGDVELLDVPQGPPLGHGIARHSAVEYVLPEHSILVLSGTSLLQGADPDSAVHVDGLRRVATPPPFSLQALCDAITEAIALRQPAQGVALLLARVSPLDSDQTAAWTLPNDPRAASRARKEVTARLADWGLDDLANGSALIVSELVTNAFRYAQGPIELRLIRDRALICEVTDESNASPHLRRAEENDEGGRGLFITAQLSERWGIRPSPRGKTIWVEQPLPAGAEPR